MENPQINTDIKIFTEPTTKNYDGEGGSNKGYEPTVFVTKEGAVGFNHYGTCFVKTIEQWVREAKQNEMLKDLG